MLELCYELRLPFVSWAVMQQVSLMNSLFLIYFSLTEVVNVFSYHCFNLCFPINLHNILIKKDADILFSSTEKVHCLLSFASAHSLRLIVYLFVIVHSPRTMLLFLKPLKKSKI